MSDFVSSFWSGYIAVITLVSILACLVLLRAMSSKRAAGPAQPEVHGNVWDEDLQEYNNPLPRWWMGLFYITIAFGLLYLVLYPGLGSFKGVLDWSSSGQYAKETQQAAAQYGPIFAKYAKLDVPALAANPEAHAIGERLFLTYCTQCHGSDARGGFGFPNLTDNDWLWGGEPQTIETTILDGRTGVMPAWGPVLGEQGVKQVANYVLSLSGSKYDLQLAKAGKEKFATNCVACHGPEGKGNQALGAPNLTDNIWLFGGSEKTVIETITNGRTGTMPAWKDFLGKEKVHLLAAYVYSFSHAPGAHPAQQTEPAQAADAKPVPTNQ
jgi:cytochrome c oxidase cbb3-type subunit III